jgi:Short C-terminal domain
MLMRRRPLLRAAAVGGGAYLAGRSVGRRAEQREYAETEQNERIDSLEQQDAPAPYQQAPAEPAAPSMLDQLSQLSTLHDQGALTDDEFTAAKARLLGS